jgi:hypothetical protein
MQVFDLYIIGLNSDVKPDKPDGWTFFESDGNTYHHINGQWIATNIVRIPEWILRTNIIPKNKSGSGITDSDGSINVVFVTQMADINYSISLSQAYKYGLANLVYGDKTVNGFTIFVRHPNGEGFADVTVDWSSIPYSNP